ncbi:hypothetical protein PR048_018864 [Dryococelus australis]|uniref:Uncharacterized protein n=1 Tax=Dryococelus australis TaxID=614101 RepID=A0ABQ9H208_9NEOP|nr:hypothetical protein PR048_018864 [Dryococelus australis]
MKVIFLIRFQINGRGVIMDRPVASELGQPCSILGGSRSRIFERGNRAGRCRRLARFLGDVPFPPYISFCHSSILTSLVPIETSLLTTVQISSLLGCQLQPGGDETDLLTKSQCDNRTKHLPRCRHWGTNPRPSESATLPLSYGGEGRQLRVESALFVPVTRSQREYGDFPYFVFTDLTPFIVITDCLARYEIQVAVKSSRETRVSQTKDEAYRNELAWRFVRCQRTQPREAVGKNLASDWLLHVMEYSLLVGLPYGKSVCKSYLVDHVPPYCCRVWLEFAPIRVRTSTEGRLQGMVHILNIHCSTPHTLGSVTGTYTSSAVARSSRLAARPGTAWLDATPLRPEVARPHRKSVDVAPTHTHSPARPGTAWLDATPLRPEVARPHRKSVDVAPTHTHSPARPGTAWLDATPLRPEVARPHRKSVDVAPTHTHSPARPGTAWLDATPLRPEVARPHRKSVDFAATPHVGESNAPAYLFVHRPCMSLTFVLLSPLKVTCNFPETLVKSYFQYVTPPDADEEKPMEQKVTCNFPETLVKSYFQYVTPPDADEEKPMEQNWVRGGGGAVSSTRP